MNEIEICVEICRKDVILPEYAKLGDSGMDVRATEDVLIFPGETKIIPTGLKVAIPEGYEIQIRARSGISLNTLLRLTNGVGTIDCNFKNEIGIIIQNTSIDDGKWLPELLISEKGNKNAYYKIKKGDRIAQLVLQKVPRIKFKVVEDVSILGYDRNSGFGGTGVE